MAKIDIIKEKINYLKVWLGIFVVTLIGLIGWIVPNYSNMHVQNLILTGVSIFILLVAIHLLNNSILKMINSLGDL
jgi:hypothetical protein